MNALLLAVVLAAPSDVGEPRWLLLAAIDVPLTVERLTAVGLDETYATGVLADAEASRYVRARALGALGLLGTETAKARVEGVLREDLDPELRIQAAISLARAFARVDVVGVKATLRGVVVGAPEGLRRAIEAELSRLDKPKQR